MAVLCLFLLLFVFMFLGVPIAISLGLSGAVSILMFSQDSVSSLAIKLFETSDERLLVNELAMRPHNSGHWTQDGAVTSQFENHIRAICGLPLGRTDRLGASAEMLNLIGGRGDGDLPLPELLRRHPDAHVHLYGKGEPRPGRKMGHVTRVSG